MTRLALQSTVLATCLINLQALLPMVPCVYSQDALESSTRPTTLRGLGDVSAVKKIADGFAFLEGPAKASDGFVYFTDIPNESIHRWKTGSEVELFFKPSLHANGLMYGGDGQLLACQMDGQLASIDLETKAVKVLASRYRDVRFNACNDLVIDKSGGIYFTDPRYRAPDPWPQEIEAVYYRSTGGKVTRVAEGIVAPNGIGLSPDEKTLYVVPSMQETVMAYDVANSGELKNERVLCKMKQPEGETNKGGDGMALDVKGNLYITTGTGVQVFSPTGKMLGTIEVPEHPANCAFAGRENKTLIITARTGLYRCETPVPGLIMRTE